MTWFGFERHALSLVWSTIFPSGTEAGIELGAADVGLDAFLDELLAHAPARVSFGLRVSLWLVAFLCPLFVLGRFATFSGLSGEERLELLERLQRSDVYLLRELPTFFKMLGALGYGGLPVVHAALGIRVRDDEPPPWATKGAR
ncbi:MAG: hypothetical protein U0263_23810 [Polyangiaceae bacterium]